MKKIISLLIMATFLTGCVQSYQEFSNPRFELVSVTHLPDGLGSITVTRDTVLGSCMATMMYGGVMSWATPCNQKDYDDAKERQMQQLMLQMEVAPAIFWR